MPDGSVTPVLRHPLKRWPPNEDGLPRYRHPGGYVINKRRRSWSLRGYTQGAHHQWSPLYWYEVKRVAGPRMSPTTQEFDTLREARAWCDARTNAS